MKLKTTNIIMLLLLCLFIMSCNKGNKSEINNNTSNETGIISSYYSAKEEELAFDNPVIFVNKMVLYSVGQDIYGFSGFVAQGSPTEGYIVGKKKGNEIIAKKYSLMDGTISPEFKLTILPKSIASLSNHEKITIPMDSIDFFEEQTLSIYQLSNFKSKVLVSDYDLQNKGFKLIEIGKMEKNGDEYNIWYKIKNKDFEGWVFGLIRTI